MAEQPYNGPAELPNFIARSLRIAMDPGHTACIPALASEREDWGPADGFSREAPFAIMPERSGLLAGNRPRVPVDGLDLGSR